MTHPRPGHQAPPTHPRRVTATRTAGIALMCAAVALLLAGSGLWPTVAGVVAAAAAVGLGITALVRSRGAGGRGLLVVSGVAAIVLGVVALVTGGARLALWPVVQDYEQCLSSTLTLSGEAECQQQLEDAIWDYFSGGSGAPTAETSSPTGS